jgi:putative peptide zinc metalloprotease protein
MRPTLSPAWYRVAALKPQLRSHARLHRHLYRGEVWYLLQDPVSNRTHRFRPMARLLIAAMDGRRSVEQLWEMANRRLGDQAPTQDEVIELLGQLHAADLLLSDAPPDASEAVERGDKHARSMRLRSHLNPLALRIHLWDPDAWLERARPWIRRLWSRGGALVWLAVVLPALLLLPMHGAELTQNFSDRVLAPDNLLMLVLLFPLIKLLHELGHAVAVKRGGGEVHDMGIMLLVLFPVPYVEASASSVFKSKYERALVAAAGMVVEVFVAALAFYGWLLAEPGLLRAALYNVMLVASVSTLLFNGNPLLRYDAYYILADLAELPNLATRSVRYWGYLVQRYAFGVEDAETRAASLREKAWLLVYGAASTAYRVLVTFGIALFVAGQFFFVGVALALWAVVSMLLMPLGRTLRHLASPQLAMRRGRVAAVTGGALAVVLGALFVLPAPQHTMAEGVTWLPPQAQVRAEEEGFVERVALASGTPVRTGDLLVQLHDPRLTAQIEQARARVAELDVAYRAQWGADRAVAGLVREQLEHERQTLDELQRRERGLQLRSRVDGVFVLPPQADLQGRRLRHGDLLAYVLDGAPTQARVVVPQEAVDLVRRHTEAVAVRLAHRPEHALPGRVLREVPQAEHELPSRALTTAGGGRLSLDPRDPEGARTLERAFQLDIELDPLAGAAGFGERVRVRFSHPMEPLGLQGLRAARRLFLSHFQV